MKKKANKVKEYQAKIDKLYMKIIYNRSYGKDDNRYMHEWTELIVKAPVGVIVPYIGIK